MQVINRKVETNIRNNLTEQSNVYYVTQHYKAWYYLTHAMKREYINDWLYRSKVVSNWNIWDIVQTNRYSEKWLLKAHMENMSKDKHTSLYFN